MNKNEAAMLASIFLCVVLVLTAGDSGAMSDVLQEQCPSLAPPAGAIVRVSTVAELLDAVNDSDPNTNVLVADGTYALEGSYLRFDTPGLTLRSSSGNRDAVVLDGGYSTAEIIQIVASDVTIADVTLRAAYYHPIHVTSSDSDDTHNTLIYNVHIIDPGEQAIKINPSVAGYYPDDGIIACSHIELTDAGRQHIRNDCYTGGIDAHQARGWLIRDNLIEGFWCEQGLSEHGIHLWRGCRDSVVERNVLRENARGIGYGLAESGDARTYPDNPCPGASGGYVDHYGGFIRNNFVFASDGGLFASESGFDCGICLWQACGAQVLHNTVASTEAPFSSIEWRFDNTDVDITNNLVTHLLMDRGGTARLSGNLESQPLATFVDGPGGDLHLVGFESAAVDRGVTVSEGLCDDDIDGDLRPFGAARDVGADEFIALGPTAVTDLHVSFAFTDTGQLLLGLDWTAPQNAVSTTLKHSGTRISESNWAAASLLAGPLAGSTDSLSTTMPYSGGTVYFALRSQSAMGAWSNPSNNAYWPSLHVWLPLLLH